MTPERHIPVGDTLELIPLPSLVFDDGGQCLGGNAAAASQLDLRPDQLPGARAATMFVRGEAIEEDWRSLDRDTAPLVRPDVALVHASAERRVDLIAQRIPDGPIAGSVVVVLVDASERAALKEQIERLRAGLAGARRDQERSRAIQREIAATAIRTEIIGASAPMLAMMAEVERVAPSDATVLIHGESGSGKELVAQAIHSRSARGDRPWIALNCAAMPETLLESELFGHERGSFTGADRQRLGKFELADTGTLFLDEIAELSPAAQAKLLRVLQDGTFVRVGGAESLQCDVRLVAATHRDLATLVRRGRFREDLFYRLNVFRIDVPPLRERVEDVKALAEHFHDRHSRKLGRESLPISERALRRMISYRWPGNVRELENTIERATLLASGASLEIQLSDAPGGPHPDAPPSAAGSRDTSGVPRDVLLDLTLDQLQRLQIMHALETSGYRVFGPQGAANKLKINPQTLLSRMGKLGIPRPRAMRASLRAQQDERGSGDRAAIGDRIEPERDGGGAASQN